VRKPIHVPAAQLDRSTVRQRQRGKAGHAEAVELNSGAEHRLCKGQHPRIQQERRHGPCHGWVLIKGAQVSSDRVSLAGLPRRALGEERVECRIEQLRSEPVDDRCGHHTTQHGEAVALELDEQLRLRRHGGFQGAFQRRRDDVYVWHYVI